MHKYKRYMSVGWYRVNMVSDVEAAIIATTVQATLTGTYFATFLLCLRWQVYSEDGLAIRRNIKWSMLIVTIVIFVLSTIDLGISLRKTLLFFTGDIEDEPILDSISYIVEPLTVLITDSVLIYRCWVAYDKWWPIAGLPLLLLLYNFASVILMTYWSFAQRQITQDTRITHIYESFFSATILINIYATTAIIMQICRKSTVTRLRFGALLAVRIIAESGLLYTITSIAALCAIVSKYSTGNTGTLYPMEIITAVVRPELTVF
ncbi:hypothetical protein AX14_013440 [Amanita brunnescens Koide BX004]|nr:hypothetical protein AX14_013440 [Amanita brunnescens Koide BX004]